MQHNLVSLYIKTLQQCCVMVSCVCYESVCLCVCVLCACVYVSLNLSVNDQVVSERVLGCPYQTCRGPTQSMKSPQHGKSLSVYSIQSVLFAWHSERTGQVFFLNNLQKVAQTTPLSSHRCDFFTECLEYHNFDYF